MSRLGKQPVVLPNGVKARIDGSLLWIEGPKGKLSLPLPMQLNVAIESDKVVVSRKNDEKLAKSMHGTIRMLIYNMVIGVTKPFVRELDIIGVGYKAQIKGTTLNLNVGFSHPVDMPFTADLKVSVVKATHIVIEGNDKQKVGEFAARVRKVAPPEPYQGKGIRYSGEEVRKKLGKALATTK